MTTEHIHIYLTYEDVAALDHVLKEHTESLKRQADPLDPQGEWDQSLLDSANEGEALRQKIDRVAFPDTRDPMRRVQAAADAVVAADRKVTDLIGERRRAIAAALEAGHTQTAVADLLGVSQPRVAHMLKG